MKQQALFDKSENASPNSRRKITYAYRISMVRDKTIRYDDEVSNACLGADLVCKTISSCGQNDREHFIIVMLNARNKIIGTNIVSVGSVNSSPIYLREVFKPAITASACAIVIGHNHPSGSLEPSPEDCLITKRIITVANLLSITFHDHVIVDMETRAYYSFSERGILTDLKKDAVRLLEGL